MNSASFATYWLPAIVRAPGEAPASTVAAGFLSDDEIPMKSASTRGAAGATADDEGGADAGDATGAGGGSEDALAAGDALGTGDGIVMLAAGGALALGAEGPAHAVRMSRTGSDRVTAPL